MVNIVESDEGSPGGGGGPPKPGSGGGGGGSDGLEIEPGVIPGIGGGGGGGIDDVVNCDVNLVGGGGGGGGGGGTAAMGEVAAFEVGTFVAAGGTVTGGADILNCSSCCIFVSSIDCRFLDSSSLADTEFFSLPSSSSIRCLSANSESRS